MTGLMMGVLIGLLLGFILQLIDMREQTQKHRQRERIEGGGMTSLIESEYFSPVGPTEFGFSFKEPFVFVEVLPSEVADVVRNPSNEAPGIGRSKDDLRGYESINDAIAELQHIGLRLLEYVKPEYLLFVFSERVQAFFDYPFCLQPGPPSSHDADKPEQDRRQENSADPRAVVFCKLENTDFFEEFLGPEEKGTAEEGDHRVHEAVPVTAAARRANLRRDFAI